MNKDPVIQLLDLVWANTLAETGHSWERLNHAMRAALQLAIGAGFPFDEATLSNVSKKYNFGRWCGESTEWIYSQAIAEGNLSAAKSFESWRGRGPFIADNVDVGHHHRFAHMTGRRQRERLAVGFEFPWKGQRVAVTSFASDGSSLTACSYKPNDDGYGCSGKVAKRFTITRDNIIAERADAKERANLLKLLSDAGLGKGPGEITAFLKIKTQAEFDALPLVKIRQAVAKFCSDAKAVTPCV